MIDKADVGVTSFLYEVILNVGTTRGPSTTPLRDRRDIRDLLAVKGQTRNFNLTSVKDAVAIQVQISKHSVGGASIQRQSIVESITESLKAFINGCRRVEP
jgi:hypothetical protein